MSGSSRAAPLPALDYRSDYFHDPRALAAFERYARAIFGLDFGLWKAKGLWDPAYRAFSAFAGDECVASLCVYPSEMRVAGERRRGAQLLTVGTLPEFRGRGIQHELWRRASAWIARTSDFAFLFTDEEAAGFYEKLGLRRRAEHFAIQAAADIASGRATGAWRKCDPSDERDYALIERLARERAFVSERLDFRNPHLLLFRILYSFRDWLYLREDPPLLVIAEDTPACVRIHDVIASAPPAPREIASLLGRFGRARAAWLFCAERFAPDDAFAQPVSDSVLFVSDGFRLAGRFMFPSSIRA